MKNRLLHLSVLILFLGFSCGTPKSLVRPTKELPSADSLIIIGNYTYNAVHTLSGRYNIDVTTGRDETSVVANIRYVKDSAVWASVYIIAGMELMRILITSDSVKFIDRLHEVFMAERVDKASKFLPFSPMFSMISNLIIPSLSIPQTARCYNCNNGIRFNWLPDRKVELQYTSSEGLTTLYTINDQGNISAITYSYGSDEAHISYKNFRRDGNISIPVKANVLLRSKAKIKAQITNVKLDVNTRVSMPIKIPNGYKKMDLNVGS